MAVVKTFETPGEHQNRWQMDVHPQYGSKGSATYGHITEVSQISGLQLAIESVHMQKRS